MPSLRSTVVATAAAFMAVAQADYTIDPNSVPLSTRQVWCRNEKNTCPLICQQMEPRTTLENDCDPTALTYTCLCGNNQRPNVSEYTLSLPYFICQEWGNQCVTGCNNDNTCQSDCREKHPCGATDPKRENKTTSTASASASKTDGPDTIYTNSPGGGSSGSGSSDKKGAGAALEVGRTYGLAVVMSGLFAGFALL